jgi:hypothetical protein
MSGKIAQKQTKSGHKALLFNDRLLVYNLYK